MPVEPEGRKRWLNADEVLKVLTSARKWLKPIIGLAVTLGPRRGELLAVKLPNVNLENGTILLCRTNRKPPCHARLMHCERRHGIACPRPHAPYSFGKYRAAAGEDGIWFGLAHLRSIAPQKYRLPHILLRGVRFLPVFVC